MYVHLKICLFMKRNNSSERRENILIKISAVKFINDIYIGTVPKHISYNILKVNTSLSITTMIIIESSCLIESYYPCCYVEY